MPLHTESESGRYLAECESDRVEQARFLLSQSLRTFDRFWRDPVRNATLLGTKAQEAFAFHMATGQHIAAIAPELADQIPAVDTARWSLEWHEDGSLSVAAIPQEGGE